MNGNRKRQRRRRVFKLAALAVGTCFQASCIQSGLAIIGATFF